MLLPCLPFIKDTNHIGFVCFHLIGSAYSLQGLLVVRRIVLVYIIYSIGLVPGINHFMLVQEIKEQQQDDGSGQAPARQEIGKRPDHRCHNGKEDKDTGGGRHFKIPVLQQEANCYQECKGQ